MKLEVDNVWATMKNHTDAERQWVDDFLSFENKNAFFTPGAPSHIRMLNLINMKFPAGLVPLVVKEAPQEAFQVEVEDLRFCPAKLDPAADLGWLRGYQRRAVEVAAEKVRGVVKIPTGGGKTEVMIGLVVAIPIKWLFVVHRANLVEQTAERYTLRTGEEAGMYGAGHKDVDQRFIVATFQTLYAALKKNDASVRRLLQECQGLLVDECHVQPAESHQRVSLAAHRAYYRIGFSATPLDRSDRRSLQAIASLGLPIFSIAPKALIEGGMLADPTVHLCPVKQEQEYATWGDGVYEDLVVKSKKRNEAVVKMVERAAKPCLLFVNHLAHGKALAKLLDKANITNDFVWGNASTSQRKAAVDRLTYGDIEVLICSVIFQEGVDIPELRSVVVASGGASVIATLQRLGRGMRRTEGKTTFEVYDIFDVGNRWLARHARAREKAYRAQEYKILRVE